MFLLSVTAVEQLLSTFGVVLDATGIEDRNFHTFKEGHVVWKVRKWSADE